MTARLAAALAAAGALAGALAAAAPPADARVRRSDVAVGLALGAPSAIDARWSSKAVPAIDVGFGVDDLSRSWSVYGEGELTLRRFEAGRFPGTFYVGFGGMLSGGEHRDIHRADRSFEVVAHAPVGADLRFEAPIEIFAELRPGLGFVGRPLHLHLGGQAGVRYVFGRR